MPIASEVCGSHAHMLLCEKKIEFSRFSKQVEFRKISKILLIHRHFEPIEPDRRDAESNREYELRKNPIWLKTKVGFQ